MLLVELIIRSSNNHFNIIVEEDVLSGEMFDLAATSPEMTPDSHLPQQSSADVQSASPPLVSDLEQDSSPTNPIAPESDSTNQEPTLEAAALAGDLGMLPCTPVLNTSSIMYSPYNEDSCIIFFVVKYNIVIPLSLLVGRGEVL